MSEPIKLLVLDLSHYDDPSDLDRAYAAGIRGVIWKCTEGTGYTDSTYNKYRKKAADTGLLWGAYHFANGSDPEDQAQHFLNKAALESIDLFCLDWEPVSDNTMSADDAFIFVNTIETMLGRPKECVIYGSSSFLTDMIPAELDAFFSFRRLWLAQYGPEPKVPPTWESYWLWQYAADGDGPQPQTVDGIPGKPDCNSFLRGEDALAAEWASGITPPGPSPAVIELDITISVSGLPEGTQIKVGEITVVSE
jgi:lysozyme